MTSTETKVNALITAENVMSEGIVLLKNNKSLPLQAADGAIKVNVFGVSSLDPEFAGGGGADISVPCIGFYDALGAAGIEYNKELFQTYTDWYAKFKDESPYAGGVVGDDGAAIWDLTDAGALNAEWNITNNTYYKDGSIRIAKMDSVLLDRAEEFSETAIVFLLRGGSEGADIEINELTIVEAEAALLEYVTANYENVIVIFNTCNLMNMGWLDGIGDDQNISFGNYQYGVDTGERRRSFGGESVIYDYITVDYEEPHTYKIGECNSAFVIWSPGAQGMNAVADVLKGDVNPSGRLIDAIPYDLRTNPVYANVGNFEYDDDPRYKFLAYEEGIYIGYQYFETFAPEQIMYSFGHGLSYTDFDWQIVGSKLGTNNYGENTVEVSVKVTNNGPYAGKDVVELYYSQPFYNEGVYGIEKSLINLGSYAKTSLLEVGKSETVKLSLNVRDMASYSTVSGCYVLEGGEYVIEIATDASNARDLYDARKDMIVTLNIASDSESDLTLVKGKFKNPTVDPNCIRYDEIDYSGKKMYAVRYTSDEATGTKYKNLFEDCTGVKEVNAKYLGRYDVDGVPSVKEGTYPESPLADDYKTSAVLYKNDTSYTYSDLTYWAEDLDELKAVVGEDNYKKLSAEVPQGLIYYDKDGNIDFYTIQEMFADISSGFNKDECWNKFLDQLSFYEMLLVNDGCGFKFPALEQYGVYWSWGNDGAAQVGSLRANAANPARDTTYIATGFPSGTALCATWSTDMAYAMGYAQGYEAYYLGHSALYAPGLNLHRSQSGGRNFEYMGEDTYLGGTIISQLCHGMQNPGGLVAGVKHYMLNDQEVNRRGVHTFLSEQALRETYGESWENCFKLGGAMGIMGAFNCIGSNWVGNSYSLNTSLLRDEWGYEGYIVSDMGAIRSSNGGYYSWVSCIISGEDALEESINWTRVYVKDVIDYFAQGGDYSNIILNSVRRNTRHVFNAWSQSNGYIENVDEAIAKLEAGGYNFDPATPDEHGYTDIGLYGSVTVGEGVLTNGIVKYPVAIDGNNGLSAATFTITSAKPLSDVIDSNGAKLSYKSSVDIASGKNNYTIEYKNPDAQSADYDLFYLVFGTDAASEQAALDLVLGYANAIDRIGHSTTLYMGSRPVPVVNQGATTVPRQAGSPN